MNTRTSFHKTYPILLVILFIAIVVRIASFAYYQTHSTIKTFEYEEVALNLIHGNGFTLNWLHTDYRAGIAPVFPALCALIYLIFGHHPALVIFLQIILSAATCAFVFFIARQFLGSACAYIAAIFTALHPGMIIFSSTMLHSLSFYSFLLCGSFFLLAASLKNYSLRVKILLGLFTGFCVLERATFLPFFILGWLWLWYYSADKSQAKKTTIISIVSLFLIVSPWVIRNTVVFKRAVFIQTNQWHVFWLGNNPQSSGTAMTPSGDAVIDASPEEFRRKLFSLDEIGQMEYFKTAAITYIRQNPGKFIGNTIKKLYYFWWFSPQAGLLYPAAYLVLYKVYYTIILSVSIIGLIWMLFIGKTRPLGILMLLLFSSNSLLHSFYYLEGRHRWSIEPLLLICFSFGAVRILRWALSRMRKHAKYIL